MNCIGCIHYKLMYERNPKRVYDGCEFYDLYLKTDSGTSRIIPCKTCADDSYSHFTDVRDGCR